MDGNLRTSFYTVADRSIGVAGDSIDFPFGSYDLKLVSVDRLDGRGFDRTSVTVEDDGGSEPLPGTEIVTITAPTGTQMGAAGLRSTLG